MKRRNLYTLVLIVTAALALIGGLALLVLPQKDLSLHQNEKKTIFGAVYMTLNNPFYQIIDTEMRSLIEANNGILLTRNPSLNAERQQEQILELVDLGAKAIFVNPVDVDNIALNDPAAMGAVAALQHAGQLSGTSVYGVDGSPDVKEMIAHGAITATAGQEPRKIGSCGGDKLYE